jgi:7-cyano-7-deazaguanine synthase in queuosine biosynthesis
MKITCAPSNFNFATISSDLNVVLYGKKGDPSQGSVGATLKDTIIKRKLSPAPRAWDLLSLALSIVSADLAGHRNLSPDGWTREFEITISVADAPFWNANTAIIEKLLVFLTTDRWTLHFIEGGDALNPPPKAVMPSEDCVVLLSGGLDSYIGAIDLMAQGHRPLAVSQIVRGDADKQKSFAKQIGGGMPLIQLNHNARAPNMETPASQRARSIVFLTYGVFAATTLARYHEGYDVTLYVCENGFIAINPPLTGSRLGSLSTRTTHPVVIALMQQLLDAAGLHVHIINPYRFKTKGEMLRECADQALLNEYASETTSCGRYKQYGYKHCGRCIPCLVRRAAFYAWKGGDIDRTDYKFKDLARKDKDYAGFDDVRSASMGVTECHEVGVSRWIGATLSSDLVQDKEELKQTVERGLREIEIFFNSLGVQ